MKQFSALLIGAALAFAGVAALLVGQPPPIDEATFTRQIGPLLRHNCVKCHNPDKSRGGLDLSTRAGLLEGGEHGVAIVVGEAAKSPLMKLISGPSPKMPRQAEPLGKADVDLLARWIDAGAPWPKDVSLHQKSVASDEWWAVQPLHKPTLPRVSDESWCRTPIDQFVLSRLDASGLKPNPEVDRAAFIRRVTFDLTGLPPTPEEIDDFVNDPSGQAFEKLVDRLLASAAYGERWARIWLDLVHYADTHGFDKDKRRLYAWLYRDWVVRALNRDLPYRRFVQYQLAGDVLFPNEPDGVIGSGFVVAGPWDFVGQVELREGTVDKEKTRTLDRDDMVSNAMATFCSVTVHCARCHDHKFDPIPTKDYYRLQAVFAGVERGDRAVITPELAVKKDLLEKQRFAATQRFEALRKQSSNLVSPELAKLDREIEQTVVQINELPPAAAKTPSRTNGYHSGIEATQDVVKWVQVDLGQPMPLDVVRLIPARPTDFADTPGFGFPLRYRVEMSDDAEFKTATMIADRSQADTANPGDIPLSLDAGKQKARYIRVTALKLWPRSGDYVFALGELQAITEGRNLALGKKVTALDTIDAGRWHRKYLVDDFDSRHRMPHFDDANERTRVKLESRLAEFRSERQRLADTLIAPAVRKSLATTTQELDAIAAELNSLGDGAKVYAPIPIKPRPIHVLARGDVERKGTLVEPGSLSLLAGLNHHFKDLPANNEGVRRAALARWITDDKNVLAWRSIVNRVWQGHFGKGLVDTPNDFGRNGSRPSHPELLDWLAADFRDGADSFKQLHRTIVLSAAYRQSSAHNAAHAKIDGDNRLLWRMNRQRLDAESLRDSVLAVSGQLDRTMFGPGYNLFRFKDDHSPVYDHLDLTHLNDPTTNRRTIYRFVVRSVPNPFLETLDCADPNISVPIRNTTLTALQALALLNDPFIVRQAEKFAARLQASETDPAKQIANAYRLAFGRRPTATEVTAMSDYAARHGLANACRLLLNANEFVFVD